MQAQRYDGITNAAGIYREMVQQYKYRVLKAFHYVRKGERQTYRRGAAGNEVPPPETDTEVVS
jgi:hypothetical protein